MVNKRSKKGQINQVFVYLMSIISILFIGFLVVKFIFNFGGVVEERASVKIYENLQKDFKKINIAYGSEGDFTYRTAQNVKLVCFAKDINKCGIINTEISNVAFEDYKISLSNGNNIAQFDDVGILNSETILGINVENDCLCVKPKNGIFSLFFENRRNNVWVSEIN